MLQIDFECNVCGSRKGTIEICIDEVVVICQGDDCGETEAVYDSDIVGND